MNSLEAKHLGRIATALEYFVAEHKKHEIEREAQDKVKKKMFDELAEKLFSGAGQKTDMANVD